jgi:hypothetical protein
MSYLKWVSPARAAALLLVPLLLVLAACGGDSGPTGPGEGDYFIRATIDGQNWSTAPGQVVAGASSPIPGSIFFQGASLGGTIQGLAFSLGRITGPGQYLLGINFGTGTGGIVTYTNGATSYNTPLNGASGTINITEITSNAVAGTFQVTVHPLVGDGDPITITNGQFRAPLSQGFELAPQDQRGNSLSATFSGAATGPFVGGTVVAAGEPATSFGFNGNNQTYMVSLSLSHVTTTGQLPLQTTVPLRRLTVTRNGVTGMWGGTAADVGTITITSLTDTRIQGTFSGTLAPVAGAVGTLEVTNGKFDILLDP